MTFNAAEKYQSQIPAIQTLIALGFRPLSQAHADKLRGKRVMLFLTTFWSSKLLRINSFSHRGKDYPFDS